MTYSEVAIRRYTRDWRSPLRRLTPHSKLKTQGGTTKDSWTFLLVCGCLFPPLVQSFIRIHQRVCNVSKRLVFGFVHVFGSSAFRWHSKKPFSRIHNFVTTSRCPFTSVAKFSSSPRKLARRCHTSAGTCTCFFAELQQLSIKSAMSSLLASCCNNCWHHTCEHLLA